MCFVNKTVIVTGAGSGIGNVVALEFGRKGANVIIADKNEESGYQTEGQIKELGSRAQFVRTDVRNEADIKNAVDEAVRNFGSLDILINNAGVSKFKPLMVE